RQHGLLSVRPERGVRGDVFLWRFEGTLHGGGRSVAISIGRYAGVWSPHGHQSIASFELVPWPSFTYLFGSARIERDVIMAKSLRAVLLRYRVSGQGSAVELRLRPLLPFREADQLTFATLGLDPRVARTAGGARPRPSP